MIKRCRVGRTLRSVMLLLSSLALIACSGPMVEVMPEATVTRVNLGQAYKPLSNGWLLSDSGLLKLIEAAERCQTK